jgi:hypothetical protein
MSVNITPIVVMIDIPNSNTPIQLKKEMIYHPLLTEANKESGTRIRLTSDTPLFTNDILYPKTILNRFPYPKIVEFFFNEEYFNRKIMEFIHSGKTSFYSENEKRTLAEFKDINSEKNVKIMLELLFHTSIIGSNFYSDSYNEYIKRGFVGNFSLSEYFQTNRFSYLKINEKVNTVVKVTFLNDLLNHPIYKELLKDIFKFFDWQKREVERINGLYNERVINLLANVIRVDSTDNKNMNILISDYMDILKNNRTATETKISKNPNPTVRSDYYEQLNKFKVTLDSIIQKIEDLRELIESKYSLYSVKPEDPKEDIKNNLLASYQNISKNGISNVKNIDSTKLEVEVSPILLNLQNIYLAYNDISNFGVRLENMPNIFRDKLNKLNNEITAINMMAKIKNNYFGEVPNLNITGESQEIVDKLNAEYGNLIRFISKLNEVLEPNRKCSNAELQELIFNVTKTVPNLNSLGGCNANNFFNFIRIVNDEMFYIRSKSKCIDNNIKKLLKVGVCYTDTRSKNIPEIYISVDLIEGEVTDKNVGKIKCAYTDRYLTRELRTVFSLVKPNFREPHKTFLSEYNIKEDGISLGERKKGGLKLNHRIKTKKQKMKNVYSNIGNIESKSKTKKYRMI